MDPQRICQHDTLLEDYYGAPPRIAEVISLINEDDTSTRLMMERGEVGRAVQRLPEDVIRSPAGVSGGGRTCAPASRRCWAY
ncbi:MAG: hypothetical protein IPK19_16740 [Chloroflexi bacterium]|nr:hypothetical protein [Chloroflexota bacterium]